MLTIENFKRGLALIILICFFLPLCQCSAKSPAENTSNQADFSTTEELIPIEEIRFQNIDELVIISVFAWPLALWMLRRFAATKPKKLLTNLAEIIFCAASLTYLMVIFRLWGDIKYGGILALVAFTSYLVTSIAILFRYIIRKVI
ncbi:MAG: hypothetical protein H6R19_1666 [Proteobacteria bacterium]|nr:hypothetical protein [Pseudomonadota bacterium]